MEKPLYNSQRIVTYKQFLLTICDKSVEPNPFKIMKWVVDHQKKTITTDLRNGQKVSGGAFDYNTILFDIALKGFELSCLEISTEDKSFISKGTIKITHNHPTEGAIESSILLVSDYIKLYHIKNVVRIFFDKPITLDGTTELTINNVSAIPVNIIFHSKESIINKLTERNKNIQLQFIDYMLQDVTSSYQWLVLKNTMSKKQEFSFKYLLDSDPCLIEIVNKNIEIISTPTWDKYYSQRLFHLKKGFKTLLHKVHTIGGLGFYPIILSLAECDLKYQCSIMDPFQSRHDLLAYNIDLSPYLIADNIGKEVAEFTIDADAEMVLYFKHEDATKIIKQAAKKKVRNKKSNKAKK